VDLGQLDARPQHVVVEHEHAVPKRRELPQVARAKRAARFRGSGSGNHVGRHAARSSARGMLHVVARTQPHICAGTQQPPPRAQMGAVRWADSCGHSGGRKPRGGSGKSPFCGSVKSQLWPQWRTEASWRTAVWEEFRKDCMFRYVARSTGKYRTPSYLRQRGLSAVAIIVCELWRLRVAAGGRS
jgi:hypothetical protein